MPSNATLVLLALTLLSSGMATKGRATVDTNIKQKAQSLTKLSSLDNKIIIMALHEAKPFVFFDCSFEVAVEEWNARHPTNPEEMPSIPSVPVQPPRTCKRENECPDAPDSEPFCGITVEIARDICDILNCTLRFYIASENPHHWENENAALAAMGAGSDVGGVHWADAAGGAIIISSDFTQIAHFTTPYFQTGFRMVTRRPAKEIKFFSFVQPFDPYLWLWLGVEMVVVAFILWIIESPENTLAADRQSDLIEGKVAGIFDAFYWTWSTYTNFVDKAPKSIAGKIVVMCQGFFMVVILASYTANLASSLTVSAIQAPFTGWELGDSPVAPDNMRTANIAIPDGGAEQTFLTFQAAKWGQDFGNVHTFDSHEGALDSVLCGNDDLMFHDESEILYYLNTAMVDLGNAVYASDICNVSQVVLPAGQDPRCALMLTGTMFGGHAYGFAFRDDTSFTPWAFTQAITVLQEMGGMDKYLSSEKYKIASAGLGILDSDCGVSNAAVNAFLPHEFFGLTLICGIGMMVGLMQYLVGRVLKYRHTLRTTGVEGECERDPTLPTTVEPEFQGLDPAVQAAINAALTMAVVGGPRGLENVKKTFEQAFKQAYEATVSHTGTQVQMRSTGNQALELWRHDTAEQKDERQGSEAESYGCITADRPYHAGAAVGAIERSHSREEANFEQDRADCQ